LSTVGISFFHETRWCRLLLGFILVRVRCLQILGSRFSVASCLKRRNRSRENGNDGRITNRRPSAEASAGSSNGCSPVVMGPSRVYDVVGFQNKTAATSASSSSSASVSKASLMQVTSNASCSTVSTTVADYDFALNYNHSMSRNFNRSTSVVEFSCL